MRLQRDFLAEENLPVNLDLPLKFAVSDPLLLQVLLQGYVSLTSESGNSVAQKVISRRSPSWNPPAVHIHRSVVLRLRLRF